VSNPIPWFSVETGPEETARIGEVIASNYINDGNVTREFERRCAEVLGVKHCVGVTSGTVGIAMGLMAVGIGPGDEVIVPNLTFIATANAVRLTGASVKLVDVEPRRFALDVAKAEAAIGPRTRAIVPVDVNGRGADYVALEALCARRGLELVCDAAEAFGSRFQGRPLGSFGRASAFSFSANKTVTTGQGGMVATNEDSVHDRLRELKDQGRRHQGTGGNDLHPVLGFNFKLTNLQAAVGLCQLDRLEARLEGFRRRNRWYQELLGDCPGIVLPAVDHNGGEITQWTDALIARADAVEAALSKEKIGSRRFWLPIHRQDSYKQADAGFEASIDASARGLWLPSHFSLTEDEAERTASVVRRVLKGRE
jgi:perosamine synthetase